MAIDFTTTAAIVSPIVAVATLMRLELVRRADQRVQEMERVKEAAKLENERKDRELDLKNSVQDTAARIVKETMEGQRLQIHDLQHAHAECEKRVTILMGENRALQEKVDVMRGEINQITRGMTPAIAPAS